MKVKEYVENVQELNKKINELPYDVWRLYGKMQVDGEYIKFGDNDSETINAHKEAITFLAQEFGVNLSEEKPEEDNNYERGEYQDTPALLSFHYEDKSRGIKIDKVFEDSQTWPILMSSFLNFLLDEGGPGFVVSAKRKKKMLEIFNAPLKED